MKTYLFIFLSIFLFSSCSDEAIVEPETEADILLYIKSKNLNVQKTSSGLYYVINNEGNGNSPTEKSVVNIEYTGTFLDGTFFGQSSSEIIAIEQVIEGIKEGLQLFKEGGEGILIIPSELA
jgi:FKBP-type peptidyl-prolyl cis-trans isomerase